MIMKEKIKKDLIESSFVKMKLAEECIDQIELATKWILESYQEGGRMVLFGNGGSAADAQHIAAEFVNYFRIPSRPMVDCLSLTTNTSILTAIANDTSYDNVFAKQIESLVNCKDVILALSTSGNAKNVIKGIEMAKKRGAKTILLTGQKGGKAAPLADLSIKVPSNDTTRIQESHIAIGHIISDIVEYELFKDYLEKDPLDIKEAEASAPVRIHLGEGGDTDYYVEKLGWGCIVNATLESHRYKCTIKKLESTNEIKVIIINSFYENKDYNKAKKEYIINNVKEKAKEDIIAATILEVFPDFKGEILIESNVPEVSGLGGSSSLSVALINALFKIKGKELPTPIECAYLSYHIERELMIIKGGYQDQFAAAFANGFNYMEFKKVSKNRKVDVTVLPLNIKPAILEKIEESLLLFYLESREIQGSNIHEEQENILTKNEEEVTNLRLEKRENILDIRDTLQHGDLEKLGKLLVKDHELKKKVSPKFINKLTEDVYCSALNMGAYGGSVCGAGSGGCIVLFCNKEKKQSIINVVESKGGVYLPCKIIK